MTHPHPIDTAADRRYKRRRGGISRSARYAHCVEGKLVATRQIAQRLGVSMTTAYDRARPGPFPLTWAGLANSKAPRARPGKD